MEKTNKKSKVKYFNIYGARFNQSEDRVNISLVRKIDDENKEWATISLPVEKIKDFIQEEKNRLFIPVSFLKEFEKKTDESSETLPF